MINLDQVRTLEWKVKKAVQLIVHLRRENDVLRGRLSDTEVRLQEFESLLESFKATQNEMESGIRNALEELDHLEGESAEVATPEVQNEPVAYPPPVAEVLADVSIVEPEPSVTEPSEVAESDLAFEEEYAALAAAEAASLVDEETEAPSGVSVVPESVELEETAEAEVDPTSVTVESVTSPEPKEPEQPGLGIF